MVGKEEVIIEHAPDRDSLVRNLVFWEIAMGLRAEDADELRAEGYDVRYAPNPETTGGVMTWDSPVYVLRKDGEDLKIGVTFRQAEILLGRSG